MGKRTQKFGNINPAPALTMVSLSGGTTRCEKPQNRPKNSQLACSEAHTGFREHSNCSFCRSILGRSRVECACCGPLHVKCSGGLNGAKDWRRGYVCGRCKRPSRVQELDQNNRSSGLSQLINQMSLNDRVTDNFPPEPPALLWTMQVLD